jgi:hypothetical protein
LFKKGKVKDVEQGHRFLMHLHLEIKKLCMVRSYYTNIEKMFAIAKEVERLLGELREMPFEPLNEEHEEGTKIDIALKNQIITLNEPFINFFNGYLFGVGAITLVANSFTMCQICESTYHITIACL